MYGSSRRASRDHSPPAHFSVHAEFTISHPGADNPRNLPRTSTERDDATGAVRMTYSWQPEWAERRARSEDRTSEGGGGARQGPPWPTSQSNSRGSIFSDTHSSSTITPPRSIPTQVPPLTSPSGMFGTPYTRGFQKGNLFFTSTPPPKCYDGTVGGDIPKDPRISLMQENASRGLLHDSSGYGSDLLSPNSHAGSLPRRVLQPFDRKCRSTCNITLSTNVTGSHEPIPTNSQCGRTQSLRCQIPSSTTSRNILNSPHYYGCGDPWCHHLRQNDDFYLLSRISPVPEENIPNSLLEQTLFPSPNLSTNKKDASVQTFEMVDKCTSPFLRMNSTDSIESKTSKKYQQRCLTEPITRNVSSRAGSFTPDSLDSVKPQQQRLLTRLPKLRRLAAFDHSKEPIKEQSPADSKASDSLKKPRTVHIDVYCTGTEMESNASSHSSEDESESKTASTPQTVFENEKVRVTHRNADRGDVPFFLKNKITEDKEDSKLPVIKSFDTNDSVEKEESDDDNASTAYPSKLSSYSNMGDFSASISSVPHSWTTYSMSSCAIPEDYDSIANTSWKDTFSDIDSLLQSRSSIAPTESLDFVPRRLYENNQSIDEAPEYSVQRKDFLETPSVTSLHPSDSFEYANSDDRLRIKMMEERWTTKGVPAKPLKSPVDESTLKIQQKRMQEYMDKKMKGKSKWDSKDSDSNDSDDSGKGYTFVKTSDKKDGVTKTPAKSELFSPRIARKHFRAPLKKERSSNDLLARLGSNVQTEQQNPMESVDTSVLTQEDLGARDSTSPLPNTVRDAFRNTVGSDLSPSNVGTDYLQKASRNSVSPFSNKEPTRGSVSLSRQNSIKKSQEEAEQKRRSLAQDKTSNTPVKQRSIERSPSPKPKELKRRPEPLKKPKPKETLQDQGSLSDSSPTSKSPSGVMLKQRLSLDPNLRSPFMLVPGIYTEPRSIARRFGTVVSVMKKPGHHIGPAKNPDCLCDHCQSYWQSVGYRNRTRSMGDPPSAFPGSYVQNWKEFLENKDTEKNVVLEKQGTLAFTDF